MTAVGATPRRPLIRHGSCIAVASPGAATGDLASARSSAVRSFD